VHKAIDAAIVEIDSVPQIRDFNGTCMRAPIRQVGNNKEVR
jgi:hypothetical protein